MPPYGERYDSNTNSYIAQAIDLADDIYIAWGSNKGRMQRIREVIKLIEKNKKEMTRIFILTDQKGNSTHISRLGKKIVRKNIGEAANIIKIFDQIGNKR